MKMMRGRKFSHAIIDSRLCPDGLDAELSSSLLSFLSLLFLDIFNFQISNRLIRFKMITVNE